jgi:hypothetical protein
LIISPDEIQAIISKFLWFLDADKNFSTYHIYANSTITAKKALNSIRPIKPTSTGKWKSHRERIANQILIDGDISESLIKFGYEFDSNWLNDIPRINDPFEKNYLKEKFSFRDFIKFKQKEIIAVTKFILGKYWPKLEIYIKKYIFFKS